MAPNDDAGFVRLNLQGRERDGIVDPRDAEALLNTLAAGLSTFRDPDGQPAIKKIVRLTELGLRGPCVSHMPDLIVQWNTRFVTPTAGVHSPLYGDIPSQGWATGRTGCHTADAWALLVPGRSRVKAPSRRAHVVDIAATVCALTGGDMAGLGGHALLEPT